MRMLPTSRRYAAFIHSLLLLCRPFESSDATLPRDCVRLDISALMRCCFEFVIQMDTAKEVVSRLYEKTRISVGDVGVAEARQRS